MATTIRPELSENNKYYVEKHRYYELKHFCLQYPEWKKEYKEFENLYFSNFIIDNIPGGSGPSDLTAKFAIMKTYYSDKIQLIEKTAKTTDDELYLYLIKAVTEGLSFTQLQTIYAIPCSRDMYYDRYRRFFWLLDEVRD